MRAHVWIRSLFQSLFRKTELDRDLNNELRACLEILIDEKVSAGMDPEQAARQARLELGGVEQVKEEVRERRVGAALDTLWQDARYAVRTLRKNAGFTVVALLILAIGIGATTALFSTVHGVLLRGVPYRQLERLVVGLKTINGEMSGPVSRVDYYDYRDLCDAFEQLAALTTFTTQFTVTGGGDPELVESVFVTWNLFPTLGVNPVAGRGFVPEEEVQRTVPTALISYGYALRRFGGAAAAVGATLVVEGTPLTIVGVMPRGFRFMYDADVWLLIDRHGPFDTQRDSHSHWVVGRLKPGVTMERAQAEVDAISEALARDYPNSNKGKALALTDLQGYMVRNVRTSLLLLMGTTVLVLLIACANVAGLLLARGERRLCEMAMRSALGASRRRLLRQLISESLILTLAAGAVGVAVAYLLQRALVRLLPIGELGIELPGLSAAALVFTLAVSIATGLFVGIVPALRDTSRPAQQLRSGTHATEGERSGRLRSVLVVLQVGLSVALLVGSGLLIRSLVQLSTVQLGFNAENLLTGQLQIQGADYPSPEERNLFYASLLDEVEALLGVESATLANRLPILSRWQDWSVWPEGEPPANPWDGLSAMARWVPPGYFETMGIPLLAGRDIAASDGLGAPNVIVVSASVAERLFPGADPIGRRVRVGDWREFEIVGVVGDARINTLRREPDAAMYMVAAQMAPARFQIAVRTAGDPTLLIQPIEELLRRKDPNVLFATPRTMSSVVDAELADFRTVILSLTLFAGVALVLAAIGLYGVLAYHVSQRKSEFGIRLAIGASSGNLIRMIMRRGLALVALGLVAGLAVAYPGTLAMRGLLYETEPLDLAAYIGAVAFLGLVAVLACYLPARRATRVDVVNVLRIE